MIVNKNINNNTNLIIGKTRKTRHISAGTQVSSLKKKVKSMDFNFFLTSPHLKPEGKDFYLHTKTQRCY